MKTCTKCGQSKPLTEYYKANKGTSYFPECKVCNRIRAKEWQRNRRLQDPLYGRRASLMSMYGITLERYEQMLIEQGGGCAICHATSPGGKGGNFHVDHCHDTGTIRGLLCHGCNTGIGSLDDSIERLEAAIKYLKKSRGES